MTEESVLARQKFADVLALYDFGSVDGDGLVQAAAGLIDTGFETDNVLVLAGLTTNKTWNSFLVEEALALVRDELGLPVLDGDAGEIRVAQAMARRWQTGSITDRDFGEWVRLNFLDPVRMWDLHFKEMYHLATMYSMIGEEYMGYTEQDFHSDLLAVVDMLLARDDPWSD